MTTNQLPSPDSVRTIAVIGTGSVGASWTALFLAHGIAVHAFDPAPDARSNLHSFVEGAWPALIALKVTSAAAPPPDRIRFFNSAAEAAKDADAVQENTPELPDVKSRVLQEISAATSATVPIMSSTGGIPPTKLQESCSHPERVVVLHPFNPSHLIPLVEVVGGEQTSEDIVQWALAFASYLGKQPIRLNNELNGHMTNRLQFALVREAVACLLEGTASAQDIDNAIRYGLGPRWALMGSFMSIHLAGGAGGTQRILSHAAAAIEEWWTPRTQPKLTSDVISRLVQAGQEVSRGLPVEAWVTWRDEQLLEVLKLQQSSANSEPGSPKREPLSRA